MGTAILLSHKARFMPDTQGHDDSERNVDALKRHPLFPFSDYRSNDEQYMLLETYWTYLFKAAIHGNLSRDWRAWRPPDSTHEGDPILSAKSESINRAVRVIQHPEAAAPGSPVSPNYFAFQAFLSHAPADLKESQEQVLELCFVADLSIESEKRCRKFWQYFCADRLSETQMEEKIRQYELAVGMPGFPADLGS